MGFIASPGAMVKGDILSIESVASGNQLFLTARKNGNSIGTITVKALTGKVGIIGNIGVVDSASGVFSDLDTMLTTENSYLLQQAPIVSAGTPKDQWGGR